MELKMFLKHYQCNHKTTYGCDGWNQKKNNFLKFLLLPFFFPQRKHNKPKKKMQTCTDAHSSHVWETKKVECDCCKFPIWPASRGKIQCPHCNNGRITRRKDYWTNGKYYPQTVTETCCNCAGFSVIYCYKCKGSEMKDLTFCKKCGIDAERLFYNNCYKYIKSAFGATCNFIKRILYCPK